MPWQFDASGDSTCDTTLESGSLRIRSDSYLLYMNVEEGCDAEGVPQTHSEAGDVVWEDDGSARLLARGVGCGSWLRNVEIVDGGLSADWTGPCTGGRIIFLRFEPVK